MKSLSIVSLLILLYSCAVQAPIASKGFRQDRITPVATHWGTLAVYPTISSNLNHIAVASYGGNIEMYDEKFSNEKIIYAKEDPEFAQIYKMTIEEEKELAKTKKDTDKTLNRYKSRHNKSGLAMKGMVAMAELMEDMGKDIKEIIDMSWAPNGNKLAMLVRSINSDAVLIYLINVKNSKKEMIRSFWSPPTGKNSIFAAGVSWKNNRKLIYSYFKDEKYNLIERNIISKKETVISTNKAIRAYYSPNGKKVAYYLPVGEKKEETLSNLTAFENQFSKVNLYVASSNFKNAVLIDKGAHIKVTNPRNLRISWSSNSASIAYAHDMPTSFSAPSHKIFTYNVRNKKRKEICSGQYINTPIFSKDNKYLYFFLAMSLYKAKL